MPMDLSGAKERFVARASGQEPSSPEPPVTEPTETQGVEQTEQPEQGISLGQTEKTPEVNSTETSKKWKYKADGKEYEATEEELLQKASYGHHASERLREVKNKEAELYRSQLQLQNMLSDPESLINYAFANGLTAKKMQEVLRNKHGFDPEEKQKYPEELEFDDDLDTPEMKMIKSLKRDMYDQQKKVDELSLRDMTHRWLSEFRKKAPLYNVPEEAQDIIQALYMQGQQHYPNGEYGIDNALNDFSRAMRDNDPVTLESIKDNPEMYDQFKKTVIEEYLAEKEKRDSETIAPKPPQTLAKTDKEKPAKSMPFSASLKARVAEFKQVHGL